MVFGQNNINRKTNNIKNYAIISINLSDELSLNVVVDGLNYNVTCLPFFKFIPRFVECKKCKKNSTNDCDFCRRLFKTVRSSEFLFLAYKLTRNLTRKLKQKDYIAQRISVWDVCLEMGWVLCVFSSAFNNMIQFN